MKFSGNVDEIPMSEAGEITLPMTSCGGEGCDAGHVEDCQSEKTDTGRAYTTASIR